MAGEATLSQPVAVESDGVLYVVGIRDGQYRIRRSADGGSTWLKYSDGSDESQVAAATSDQRAGLVKLNGQGRPLLVCISEGSSLSFFRSLDDGETWVLEGAL